MHRRALLSSLGLALTSAFAGCLGGGTPPVAGGGDRTDTPEGGTDTHPRFLETSLTSMGQCDNPGTAAIDFGSGVTNDGVTVTGCAHGRNGCAVPILADVSYDPKGDLLTIVVASEVRRDEDQMCTEALSPLGYEARVLMDGMVPGTVRVVHDDVDGRREVARAGQEQP